MSLPSKKAFPVPFSWSMPPLSGCHFTIYKLELEPVKICDVDMDSELVSKNQYKQFLIIPV
jgi:hypothetical protein